MTLLAELSFNQLINHSKIGPSLFLALMVLPHLTDILRIIMAVAALVSYIFALPVSFVFMV
jgi:hypothetical protein